MTPAPARAAPSPLLHLGCARSRARHRRPRRRRRPVLLGSRRASARARRRVRRRRRRPRRDRVQPGRPRRRENSLLVDFAWVNVSTDFTRRTVVTDGAGNESIVTSPTVTGTTPFLPIPTHRRLVQPDRTALFTFAPASTRPTPRSRATRPRSTASRRRRATRSSRSRARLLVDRGALRRLQADRADPHRRRLRGARRQPLVEPGLQREPAGPPPRRAGVAAVRRRGDAEDEDDLRAERPLRSHRRPEQVPPHRARVPPAVRRSTSPPSSRSPSRRRSTFDNARQEGNTARVHDEAARRSSAPGSRSGPPTRSASKLAYVREQWSVHRAIDVTPTDLALLRRHRLSEPVQRPAGPASRETSRRRTRSVSAASTACWRAARAVGVDLRAGVNYETSAIPDDYLTPLTADLDRVTARRRRRRPPTSRGAPRRDVRPRLQLLGRRRSAHRRGLGREPGSRKSDDVPQPINGGTYSNAGNIVGLGATVRF